MIDRRTAPLMTGVDAERAWGAIHRVERELAAAVEDEGLHPDFVADAAVLFHYLLHAEPTSEREARARASIDRTLVALEAQALDAKMFGGFVGVAWSLQHLRRRGWLAIDADASAAIDEALLERLALRPGQVHFDLVTGLAGFATYALEREPSEASLAILRGVSRHLAATRREGPRGVWWHTEPRWLAPWQRAAAERGWVDVGLTHGMGCVIRTLAELGARDATREDQAVVERAADFLLSWENAVEGSPAFPYTVADDAPRGPARVALCYGDAGLAGALLASAHACGSERLKGRAIAIARRAAALPAEACGVVDAGLCHGAAGLGHVFARFFRETGDDAFRAAARRWFDQVVTDYIEPEGTPLFRSFDGPERGWLTDRSLLSGSAGVALALLGAVTGEPPEWDRRVLQSADPAHQPGAP